EVAELPGAIVGCLAYGDSVLAESFVEGVEVAVTVLDGPDGPRALPAVEIDATSGFYDYTARYTAGLATFHAPARLDSAAAAAVADLAVSAHRILGLRDVSRTDVVVTPDGVAQFLEVNVAPGLTETSLLPMAIESTGAHLGTIYAALIERAIARGPGTLSRN
ncbi:MAG: D-alanine--D-alanine ligase, partial [Pseudonocardiaceae bacterium]